MNSIKLSNYYRLYAFSDYRTMKSALPYMSRVVLAKGLAEVQEAEIKGYLGRISGRGYINYLELISHHNPQRSAGRSFISALQMLYKSNGYSARYIVIERV